MDSGNYWNRCDVCGRFISYDDLDSGLASITMVTPDSDYSSEEYETLCRDCNVKAITEANIIHHREDIFGLMLWFDQQLVKRAKEHDSSKFSNEEFPELMKLEKHKILHGDVNFNSPEYDERKKILENMLKHHYANNRHHPEHFENGVDDMTLIDIIEMFLDWFAAAYRRNHGKLNLHYACEKYNVNSQLEKIFENTVKEIVKDIPRYKVKVEK